MGVTNFCRPWRRLCRGLAAVFVFVGGAVLDVRVLAAPGDAVTVPAFTPAFAPAIDEAVVSEVAFRGAFPPPAWQAYALTDALFWGRDNQAANQPLVIAVDGAPATVISTRDLQFPFSEGVRAFYGRRDPDHAGWEIGYWGVWGQSATQVATATPPNYLQMPDPLGGLMTDEGSTATVKYNSFVNSAEANVFRTRTGWRDHSGAWLTVDWLLGFRYVGVDERASIIMDCCVMDDTKVVVPYTARTRNNGFGAQIGNRTRWTWENWAFEGWAKAGLLGTAMEQLQDPLVDYTGYVQRQATDSSRGGVSFIGDINMSLIYRLTDVWGIRAGYNLIWIDGLALAPNQFDFSVAEGSGSRLVSGGGIFMHGANLGLEARW